MLQVETKNSTYLIDEDNRKVKRLQGTREPTNYQTMIDEEGWKEYDIFEEKVVNGGSYLIFYWLHEPKTPGTDMATTQTSLIKGTKEI